MIDALRSHRVYAATDNIILDVRAGGHWMGEAFEAEAPPLIRIRAICTAPINRVSIIRDERHVHEARPASREIALDWRDADPSPGTHRIYVRVMQTDGQCAWASPVWITVR
ncbi:MAG: hypothetical protein JXP34_00045 [Planctomycetes bacterium]|nr:hypothetical protein [Planctomycetota bacterium]